MGPNLTLIFISLDELIGHLSFTTKEDGIFENIFGNKSLIEKDFRLISQNSLFIFCNIFWSNILLKFKICGVEISGGSSSKRHIFNTVDYQLINNCKLYYDHDHNIIRKLIYDSLNNPILSSSITLYIYNKYLSININNEIKSIKIKEFNNLSFLKSQISGLDDREDKLLDIHVSDLIKHNFFISYNILFNSIITKLENKLNKLKDQKVKLEKEYPILKYELNRQKELPYISTKYLSNKNKKKLKKERTALIKDSETDNRLEKMQINLDNNLNILEELKNIISNKEKEIIKFKETYQNKSLMELNKLNELYSKNENKEYKFTKNISNIPLINPYNTK